MPNHVKPIIIT